MQNFTQILISIFLDKIIKQKCGNIELDIFPAFIKVLIGSLKHPVSPCLTKTFAKAEKK